MRKFLGITVHTLIFCLLTIISQVGGIFYLLTLILTKRYKSSKLKIALVCLAGYLASALVLIPLVAPSFGRVPLPLYGNLKPLNFATCLLNRHYVDPELKKRLLSISGQMHSEYEGTQTNYLDANFPFINGFPLIPHLSHNDGRKIDLAFYYRKDSNRIDYTPSFIGYGVYEDPEEGEIDYPSDCRKRGYWQYGILSSFVPQNKKYALQIDEERNTRLLKLLAEDPITSKIFIEPHLRSRWNLKQLEKIRFHGCRAVRHDDHIHLQIGL